MATNSGRGNPIAAADGPSKAGEGAPPAVPADVKDAVRSSAPDAAGLHQSGQDAGAAPGAPPKVKTEKECMSPRACPVELR